MRLALKFSVFRIYRSSAIYFFASFAPRILTFATLLVLAHALDADDYGRISLMSTIAILLGTFASSWISVTAYRFSADRDDSRRAWFQAEALAA
jgi:O-antigen/teichoic acid export membrane protein